jgi:predicted TIM-barrel fold metal-dependent hydrolase
MSPSANGSHAGLVDCDIHNTIQSYDLLHKHLPARWRREVDVHGIKFENPGAYFPRQHMNAARSDSWPPGKIPGSDLDFLRAQLLDCYNIDYGILNCLYLIHHQADLEYTAALATAVNNYNAEYWMDREPRLRAAICVAFEDGDLAAAEIERCAADPRFLQVLVVARSLEPLGRRKYWRMYAAAERHGLPVAVHFGGTSGWPITGSGWPSYYYEDHCGMAQSFQAQIISLVFEGVFERFPGLKVVLVEGGFGWLAPLMWRMDKAWERMGDDVPHVKQPPSEYIRRHFYFTTQPVEEPPKPAQFRQMLEQIDMNDRILFATDYPHWDFDSPERAIPAAVTGELRQQILAGNAEKLYRLNGRM